MNKKNTAASQKKPRQTTAKREKTPPAAQTSAQGSVPFIVGLGASGGGLEAFAHFFPPLPADTGMAYVLVPHIDPSHKSMMPELLQRASKMPVVQIADGITVEPNTVYVIPPNADLAILHGTLVLSEPSPARGLRLPIDSFFKSLAEDQDGKAIAIVLSGMGSDGTLGIKAIKERNGMVLVQDPESARYPSMPQSAIATRQADIVAPAEDLPARLIEYARTYTRMTVGPEQRPEKAGGKIAPALQRIYLLLRSRTGHDFSLYKRSTICRRIERRMAIHKLGRIADYARYLHENPKEIDLLFNELLIGVTGFFREPQVWESLKGQLIQYLRNPRGDRQAIRVWDAGCSTGEEAYSLAILLLECMDVVGPDHAMKIQIFATDIDTQSIEIARQGLYLQNIAADVSPERLNRFFVREDDRFRIKQEVRDTIVFAEQDLIMDPPFTRMDLVCCRNVLIYFTPELQHKILQIFHYALCPGGLLVLGTAESIGGAKPLFHVLDAKGKVYLRQEASPSQRELLEIPVAPLSRQAPAPRFDRQAVEKTVATIAPEMLLEHYAPPAIFVTREGDIIYFHGQTGPFLQPSAGKANLNVYTMLRKEIRSELLGALQTASRQKRSTTLQNVTLHTDGRDQRFAITVTPVQFPDGNQEIYMIVFQEAPPSTPAKTRRSPRTETQSRDTVVAALETELRETKARLQSTVEENQATQEELRSMNEELRSANEELQSTNEELISSKEEYQSLNEELTTVNTEMQAKISDLTASQNDLRNVLNSTELAVLILDTNLRVRRYTPATTGIVKLIGTDVGRPITDLSVNLDHENLANDAQSVLETLQALEKQVQTPDGRWFILRIVPYRTIDNMIAGVTITFSEITGQKNAEISVREASTFADSIIATVREPLVVLDADLRIVRANRSFYTTFKVDPKETERQLVYEVGDRQWDIPELRKILEEVLPKNTIFEDFTVEHDFSRIGHRIMRLNARKIQADQSEKNMILLAIEDATRESRTATERSVKRSHPPR